MGLAEKRALSQLREETVPKQQRELQKITGSKVVYAVDWDSFADNATAIANLEAKCLQPLNEILRQITVDKIGQDAVKESIQSIALSQGRDANISNFTLSDGVLTLPWDWESWPGSFFSDSVREKIETML